jgi:hypothetical protein
MARQKRLNLVTVDDARFNDAVEQYFLWKELDASVRTSATRGVNFPETISEALCCYVMGLHWNKGSGGDAVDVESGMLIEMKATSNWDSDTTSFSPEETFDNLLFLRLNKRNDMLYIYDTGINSDTIKNIKVNKTETLEDQQLAGRRPRFSVIKTIIEPLCLEPVAELNLRTLQIRKR